MCYIYVYIYIYTRSVSRVRLALSGRAIATRSGQPPCAQKHRP